MFQEVYDNNIWAGEDDIPKSGGGSTLPMTVNIREAIKSVVLKYNIKSIVDAPCGDLTWIQTLFPFFEHGVEYIGVDIVPSEIARHKVNFPSLKFYVKDMVFDMVPKVDLIFSREALQHMNVEDNVRVTRNWQKSGSKYLMQTNYIYNWVDNKGEPVNVNDISVTDGHTIHIDFLKEPYNWKEPIDRYVEKEITTMTKGRVPLDRSFVEYSFIWDLRDGDVMNLQYT